MNSDEVVANGLKNITEAYEVQDSLLRQLHAVTQNLISRTRVAMEYAAESDMVIFGNLLRQHMKLAEALEDFVNRNGDAKRP